MKFLNIDDNKTFFSAAKTILYSIFYFCTFFALTSAAYAFYIVKNDLYSMNKFNFFTERGIYPSVTFTFDKPVIEYSWMGKDYTSSFLLYGEYTFNTNPQYQNYYRNILEKENKNIVFPRFNMRERLRTQHTHAEKLYEHKGSIAVRNLNNEYVLFDNCTFVAGDNFNSAPEKYTLIKSDFKNSPEDYYFYSHTGHLKSCDKIEDYEKFYKILEDNYKGPGGFDYKSYFPVMNFSYLIFVNEKQKDRKSVV